MDKLLMVGWEWWSRERHSFHFLKYFVPIFTCMYKLVTYKIIILSGSASSHNLQRVLGCRLETCLTQVKVNVLVTQSCTTLCTPWTAACQAPLSMGFPRQEYWSGQPFPSPGDLPHPGITLQSRAVSLYRQSQQGSWEAWLKIVIPILIVWINDF